MMNHIAWKRKRKGVNGFTLIEIIVVVVILGIAALIAVPMFSGAADMQVRAAANRIAADLDYAKGMAVTYQKPFCVVFKTTDESYEIQDQDGVIKNPVQPSADYVVNLSTDSNFSRVEIDTADFDPGSTDTITFGYLGSPYSGTIPDSANALNSGTITLTADEFTLYVKVEPMTGYVTIDDEP